MLILTITSKQTSRPACNTHEAVPDTVRMLDLVVFLTCLPLLGRGKESKASLQVHSCPPSASAPGRGRH